MVTARHGASNANEWFGTTSFALCQSPSVKSWFATEMPESQQTIDEVELLRDVRTAVEQIESGQGVSNRAAKAELRKRFGR